MTRRSHTKEEILGLTARDPPPGKVRVGNADFLRSFERALGRVRLENRPKWYDYDDHRDRFAAYYEVRHHKARFDSAVPFVAACNAERSSRMAWKFYCGLRFPEAECDVPLYSPREASFEGGRVPFERMLFEAISKMASFQEAADGIAREVVGPYQALLFLASFVRQPHALAKGCKDLDNTTTEKDMTWAWTRFRRMKTRSLLGLVKAFCWRQERANQNAARALRVQMHFVRKVLDGRVKRVPKLLREL